MSDGWVYQSGIDDATERAKHDFLGWFNLDRYLSKGYDVDNGFVKHYINSNEITEHTVLIPRYELKMAYRNYLNVWLDSSNSINGGTGTPAFTMYARKNGQGNIEAANR